LGELTQKNFPASFWKPQQKSATSHGGVDQDIRHSSPSSPRYTNREAMCTGVVISLNTVNLIHTLGCDLRPNCPYVPSSCAPMRSCRPSDLLSKYMMDFWTIIADYPLSVLFSPHPGVGRRAFSQCRDRCLLERNVLLGHRSFWDCLWGFWRGNLQTTHV